MSDIQNSLSAPLSDLALEYRRLLNSMPVMLWTADTQGTWNHVNGAWVQYTGMLGKTHGFGFEQALHPDDEARTVAVWSDRVAHEVDYEIEYRLRRRDSVYRWFLVRGVRVRDEDGWGIAWVGTCTDVDDQKRAEQEAVATREEAVRALGLALEARDRETQGHSDRVTHLAVRLGEVLGLNEAQLEALRLGARLHDLGKLSISDTILLKPGPLDEHEWALMREHATEGRRLAAALGFVPPDALAVIGLHHERWDGSGYPGRLTGENIPLLARIFAVVDVYDALSSERPYKPAWTPEQVVQELHSERGRQLDPQVVDALLELLRSQTSFETGAETVLPPTFDRVGANEI